MKIDWRRWAPHSRPWPRSIRVRYALAVGTLFLITLTVVGALVDLGIRDRISADLMRDTRLAIVDWTAEMRPGHVPPPPPTVRADYLQLVDSKGRVVAANAEAAGKPPLTTFRPAADDRLQDVTVCPPQETCMLVTALRPNAGTTRLLWNGEPHFIYAGTRHPPALASHYLEVGIGAAVLFASVAASWATWLVVGRTLHPVRAISARMREATAGDLSLRVPAPPGDDEIAQLARTSNAYLERLEKAVTAQRRFASLASHELRSPVAALHAELEDALAHPDDTDARATIRATLRTAERLQAVIDDLLAYTRVKNTRPSAHVPLDLAAVVREEAAVLSRGTPIRLCVADRPTVLGSHVQLAGVVHNLLANARRHAHSRVDVTVGRVGGKAVVTVQDDGAGIAPEDRERVFEAFTRLREGRRLDPGGSGLGLAICRETSLAHGGSLTIEDCPKGTRFVLRLPVTDPTVERDGEKHPGLGHTARISP
ncbi:HAMP domain-containing histidine kinase [Microbispora sp. RL4-1S]|uniref:histidine kinase n=1 Tax=Microbispora oryzae TaxID=2806554 RepID=A0A940WCU6_9ACTN|nr:HAMP domain-containing sensor histidine kinase [Microbispora oryzae]MBP2703145.1 HAMP domain-containing histidine kinase [Microbispora oryzae]